MQSSVAGQPARVLVHSGDRSQERCGLRINHGNGDGSAVKNNDASRFPKEHTFTYPEPGALTISRLCTHLT